MVVGADVEDDGEDAPRVDARADGIDETFRDANDDATYALISAWSEREREATSA